MASHRLNAHNAALYPLWYTQATWFEVGLGACGYTDTDADFIVALPASDYGSGSNCNKVRSTPFLAGFGDTLTSSRYHLHRNFKSPTQGMAKLRQRPCVTCAPDVPLEALVSPIPH